MKLITGVEIKEVERDVCEIYKMLDEDPILLCSVFEAPQPVATEYAIETVRGQRFVNKRGEEIVIGMDKATQELIGLPFECFHEMNDRLDKAMERLRVLDDYSEALLLENQGYESVFEEIKCYGFWRRIKFIFTHK